MQLATSNRQENSQDAVRDQLQRNADFLRNTYGTNATRSFTPQQIILAHANLPTITHCYDQLTALINGRGLQTVTLNDVFGSGCGCGAEVEHAP